MINLNKLYVNNIENYKYNQYKMKLFNKVGLIIA